LDRDEQTLRAAYRAFNERNIKAALDLMHPEVDWPNAWEGGRVSGREEVAAYWARQFEQISSRVEPQGFSREKDGSIAVDVHQVVRDAGSGELISDSRVVHRWRFEDGLVVRMDVVEPEEDAGPAD
jgi:ketosteroid isomerase-like protein